MSQLYLDKQSARQAYMNPEAIAIRRQIDETYSVPHVHFPSWVLHKYRTWRGDEKVLDINPGDGAFFDLVAENLNGGVYIATDSSLEMLGAANQHQHAPHTNITVSQTHQLPFSANSFDLIIADHILYHVHPLEHALKELKRVLREDGILIASTASQYTMGEFDTLTRRVLTLLGRPPRSNDIYYGHFIEPFALENGAVQLARHFRGVARYEVPSTLVFKDTRPVIDFLQSIRVALEPALPEDIQWDDYLATMADQIRRLISHFGELTVNRLNGVLLATNSGGFASDYFQTLDNS